MATILGLDLGSSSIGWAVINYSENVSELSILGMGSRVIPVDGEIMSKFNSGQAIEINAKRTALRTARKLLDRYQQRRGKLMDFLQQHGMYDAALTNLPQPELWGLRAKAAETRISLPQLGRVLLHINQKRGYRASKADLADDNKKTKGYVAEVRSRYQALLSAGQTPGQYYYDRLKDNPDTRIKGEVLPRNAYLEETDKILETQAEFYPETLTPAVCAHLRDYIMFYQRPLKSCKHLVNDCEFVSIPLTTPDGKQIMAGPKVAQKSNPLFQLSRIWQAINNITLHNRRNETMRPDDEERRRIFHHMQTHDALKLTDLYSILFNKKKSTEWSASDNIGKGIPGNKTLMAIRKALDGKYPHLLEMELDTVERADPDTGEIRREISPSVTDQPLYQLWHVLYSISDMEHLTHTLRTRFGIDDSDVLENLTLIDFVKEGYGNMSVKAIRRILPALMDGAVYSDACAAGGFRHSESLTSEENDARQLLDRLPQLRRGELRQPVVEKILNQMVNLVNSLIDRFGAFDEIHVELARELRMSRDERSETTKRINDNEARNKKVAERIQSEYGLTPTLSRITKYKLWEETKHFCIYCNRPIDVKEFLLGFDSEVEHIVPKSLLFDDSFANKTCSCRSCNQTKGNQTAYDFMRTKSEAEFAAYMERIAALKDSKAISKTKYAHLAMAGVDIPSDFIDRQLRQSQYIARKALEHLRLVCRTVNATSGSVTDYLRHIWGWDRILHDINLDRYAATDGLVTEVEEVNGDGTCTTRLRIKDWSKRMDHRHHAIDALTIACTNQAVIKQLNDLSSLKDKAFRPFLDQDSRHKDKQSRLEHYVLAMPHFSTAQVTEAVNRILVSLKPASRLVTDSRRMERHGGKQRCVQSHILTPRGPLHEDTVYGKILRYDAKGQLHEEVVVRYPLSSLKESNVRDIVDTHIRRLVQQRFDSVADKKKAFADPLYSDAACKKQIRSVRCFTGITSPSPVRRDPDGKEIGFVKPGSNYHMAIYRDKDGNLREHIATFKHCVERRLHGIPAIIENPREIWDRILASPEAYDENFLAALPGDDWEFLYYMQRNEMFVLGLTDDEFARAMAEHDYALLSRHLYRVQCLSKNDYTFSLHTQTKSDAKDFNKPDRRFVRIRNTKSLMAQNPRKVRVDSTGEIVGL